MSPKQENYTDHPDLKNFLKFIYAGNKQKHQKQKQITIQPTF
jgi:hypothetical protein